MTSKHIPRDYSAHRKNTIRPSGEYCGLEIFSYDPKFTYHYLRENNTLPKGTNCKNTGWRSWACYCASNQSADMTLTIDYNVREVGEYRIDFLYEQNSRLYNGVNSTGEITVSLNESIVYYDGNVLFDGEDNFIKRIPIFLELNQGNHTISVDVPPNIYFYGIIVRKIVKYTANNYYGADAGKDSGNMMFQSASLSLSSMTKPSELTVSIAYDNDYECPESPSGFYIDFMDEVNFYIKNNDGDIVRAFGGYVSSILPNNNNTELSIHCADRLVDGQNKYVLDYFNIQNGTGEEPKQLHKNFKNYTHILKYLCDVHETTLHSNISPNYLVEGEKFNNGLSITYGKNKTVKSVSVSNGKVSVANNHITLRNNPSGAKKQVWTLYNAKTYGQVAPNITDIPYLHLTYGLGSPKSTKETKHTETVDTTETTVGVQKFSKCGVSEDKKYLMAIGLHSAGKDTKKGWTKTIFERKCPYCDSKELYWGIFWAGNETSNYGTFPCTGRYEGGSAEGHIFCKSCDKDYSVQGHEHVTKKPYTLKKVSSTVSSSKKEAYKLLKGEMSAVPKTGVAVNPDDIFKAITKEAFKYKYGSSASSYSKMKKTGKGDCWAFSDLIFTWLKKYDVTCKIVQYATNQSDRHRSVMYKNAKNEWVDFPYREYGWNTKYNNILNNTSASKTGSKIDSYTGHSIGSVKVSSKKTSKKETTKITTTTNYDKDKPFQGYLKIIYSNDKSLSAPKKTLYLKFTQRYTKGDAVNEKGFPLYWVNNSTKEVTFVGSDGKSLNITEWIHTAHNSNEEIYLQSIQMITPVKSKTSDNDDGNWYTYDKSTHDESSCKMDLYQIIFDNNPKNGGNAEELHSSGKSVNSMLQEIVEDTGYLVHMNYGLHRKDDQINFRVNNTRATSYTASEGNDNNILEWNSISYTPISSMFNMSIEVFKMDEATKNEYYYVDSRIPTSILEYGEQAVLETSNEPISKQEAYFNARMNSKFNGEQSYSYTITVPNYPNLRLGEFVKVVANAKKLNSVKEVKSLKITFDSKKMPRIRTEIGLDELSPQLRMKEEIRRIKSQTKNESTAFSSSATPINDETLYQWDR